MHTICPIDSLVCDKCIEFDAKKVTKRKASAFMPHASLVVNGRSAPVQALEVHMLEG